MTVEGWQWRQFQAEDIDTLVEAGGVGLISHCLGAGKTPVALEVLRRLGAQRIAVTAPINTFYGWERHAKMFLPDLPVRYIDSKRAEDSLAALKAGEPGIYMVGWEWGRGSVRYAKNPDGTTITDRRGNKVVDRVIREQLDWSKYPLDASVFDEIHRGGNRRSIQAKIMHSAKKVPIKLGLSATPAGNKIENIWSVLHFLWPQRYKYFGPFTETFLRTQPNPYATYQVAGRKVHVQEVIGEKAPGIVARSIPTYVKRTEEEVHNELPEVVVHDVPVDLLPAQRRVYRQFEEDALAWLEDNPVAAALPITKRIRLRQVGLAVPSVNDEEEVSFKEDAKSSKLDAMVEILEDLPEAKALVWTHSKRIIPTVLHRLRKAGYTAVAVHGGQSKDAREAALAAFRSGEADVLVATITAMSEGVDGLQHVCSTEIWLSKDESVTANRQAEGRLRRPGQKQVINRFIMYAKDTLETGQLGKLKIRQDGLVGADFM